MAALRHAIFAILMAALSCGSSQNISAAGNGNKTSEQDNWIPGTKWCGPGNVATNLGHLGVNNRTDSCCRAHDQCNMTIPALTHKWGIFNHKLYTMSHCDCEETFHDCLKSVGNSASRWTEAIYFKWLRPTCFRLVERRVCAKYTFDWWHFKWVCERYQTRKFAERFQLKTLGFERNANATKVER